MLTLSRGQRSSLAIAVVAGSLLASLWTMPAFAGHESTKEGYTWEPGVTHLVPIPYDGRHFNNWQCTVRTGCFWGHSFDYGDYYGDSCRPAPQTKSD